MPTNRVAGGEERVKVCDRDPHTTTTGSALGVHYLVAIEADLNQLAKSGSSAVPQIGQLPGASRRPANASGR